MTCDLWPVTCVLYLPDLDEINWQLTNGQTFNWQLTNNLIISSPDPLFVIELARIYPHRTISGFQCSVAFPLLSVAFFSSLYQMIRWHQKVKLNRLISRSRGNSVMLSLLWKKKDSMFIEQCLHFGRPCLRRCLHQNFKRRIRTKFLFQVKRREK